jgi:predicted DNA-binding transcriptional regulator AlpA
MLKNLNIGSRNSSPQIESNQEKIGQYLRQRQLLKKHLPFSASTLWRKVRNGDFPAPVKLSAGITAWRLSDVNEWLTSKGKPR